MDSGLLGFGVKASGQSGRCWASDKGDDQIHLQRPKAVVSGVLGDCPGFDMVDSEK